MVMYSNSSNHYNSKRRHRRNNKESCIYNKKYTEEQIVQIRDEGYGRLYIQKQIRNKTSMIFELYNETISGARIIRLMKYFLTILVDGEKRNINKLDIKYYFKQADVCKIRPFIEYNERIRNDNLLPIVKNSERFSADTEIIDKYYRENKPVSIILRGGEIVSGTIDWYSRYEIKICLPTHRSVVTFIHAYYDFKV